MEVIVLHYWNKMTTLFYLLAHALSPRYYSKKVISIPGRLPPYRDVDVANGYKRALTRPFQDEDSLHMYLRKKAYSNSY